MAPPVREAALLALLRSAPRLIAADKDLRATLQVCPFPSAVSFLRLIHHKANYPPGKVPSDNK